MWDKKDDQLRPTPYWCSSWERLTPPPNATLEELGTWYTDPCRAWEMYNERKKLESMWPQNYYGNWNTRNTGNTNSEGGIGGVIVVVIFLLVFIYLMSHIGLSNGH